MRDFLAIIACLAVLGSGHGPDTTFKSSNRWSSSCVDLEKHTGKVSIRFNLIPQANNIDGVMAFTKKSINADSFRDFPVLVRMNTSSFFEARDGNRYKADNPVTYQAGIPYYWVVKISIDLQAKRYDVGIVLPGSDEFQVVLAENYAFRSDGPSKVNDIGQMCLKTPQGTKPGLFKVTRLLTSSASTARLTSAPKWDCLKLSGQKGVVHVDYDVTPNRDYINGVVGLTDSSISPSKYSDFPMSIRMYTNSMFEARYRSIYTTNHKACPYEAGKTYTIKVNADLKRRRYNVTVSRDTGTRLISCMIASNYKFRTDGPPMNDLGLLCLRTPSGTPAGDFEVSNIHWCSDFAQPKYNAPPECIRDVYIRQTGPTGMCHPEGESGVAAADSGKYVKSLRLCCSTPYQFNSKISLRNYGPDAAPASVRFFLSDDNFYDQASAGDDKLLGTVTAVVPSQGTEDFVLPYEMDWESPEQARYIIAVWQATCNGTSGGPYRWKAIGKVRKGKPRIPGKIQAQDYTRAYDKTPDSNDGQNSSCYRGDGVDMIDLTNESGDCAVNRIWAGEWLEYDVYAKETGFYTVNLRVAGKTPNKWFHVELDGLDVTGKVSVPTKGWSNYQTVSVDNIYVTKGDHTLRVFFDTGQLDFNWFSWKRSPRRVKVTAVMARDIRTCVSGVPCSDQDDNSCLGLYNDTDTSFIKGFRDARAVPSTYPVPANHEKECIHLTFDDTVMADIANELQEMRSNVFRWSKQQLLLDIDIIDVSEEQDVFMTNNFNTLWLAPWDFQDQIRSRLTYNPDFTLIFNNIRDQAKGIYHSLNVCGLAYGAGFQGMAGGGHSWLPITNPPLWFQCYQSSSALIHEWMHQVHTAYTQLSGFDDKFDRNYPPCNYEVKDPLSYFPDSHDIHVDPGSPWCGTSIGPPNDEVMEHILSQHWDPQVNFTANHCENGVKDYGEVSVDKGGDPNHPWDACLGHSIRPLDAAQVVTPVRPDPIPEPEFFSPIPTPG